LPGKLHGTETPGNKESTTGQEPISEDHINNHTDSEFNSVKKSVIPEEKIKESEQLGENQVSDKAIRGAAENSAVEEDDRVFDLAEVQGPNLSEDEDSSDDSSLSSSSSDAVDSSLNTSKMEVDSEDENTSPQKEMESSEKVDIKPDTLQVSHHVNGEKGIDEAEEDVSKKDLSNDLNLSDDSNSMSGEEDVGDKKIKPMKIDASSRQSTIDSVGEDGKVVVSSLLDHCETLEKNLNLAAMDMEGTISI